MQLRFLIAGLILLNAGSACAAQVFVSINESSQEMTVSIDGQQQYVWPVSTGITRYATPTGTYKPFRMEEDHFSQEWDDAPMPHSIFFTPWGHAIHGTEHVDNLGRRASHGCVRLAPEDAATLYALVEEAGMANTTVVVKGRADKPVSKKPPQQLVESTPVRPPLRLAERTPLRLVEPPLKKSQFLKYRRGDDPFLWRESFN
jgi:lipoprotein-anchoring transpeptidase ErfK/SrfK